jgi:hypothetical protein
MAHSALLDPADFEQRDSEWRNALRHARPEAPEAGGQVPLAIYGTERYGRLWPFAPPDEETRAFRVAALGSETMRRVQRLAAGPHGFAALRPGGGAAPPELQQLLSHVLQPLVDNIANLDPDVRLKAWRNVQWNNPLLAQCTPHVAAVLVADVAVGLLCPRCGNAAARMSWAVRLPALAAAVAHAGGGPRCCLRSSHSTPPFIASPAPPPSCPLHSRTPPPDAPEHLAALDLMLRFAFVALLKEADTDDCDRPDRELPLLLRPALRHMIKLQLVPPAADVLSGLWLAVRLTAAEPGSRWAAAVAMLEQEGGGVRGRGERSPGGPPVSLALRVKAESLLEDCSRRAPPCADPAAARAVAEPAAQRLALAVARAHAAVLQHLALCHGAHEGSPVADLVGFQAAILMHQLDGVQSAAEACVLAAWSAASAQQAGGAQQAAGLEESGASIALEQSVRLPLSTALRSTAGACLQACRLSSSGIRAVQAHCLLPSHTSRTQHPPPFLPTLQVERLSATLLRFRATAVAAAGSTTGSLQPEPTAEARRVAGLLGASARQLIPSPCRELFAKMQGEPRHLLAGLQRDVFILHALREFAPPGSTASRGAEEVITQRARDLEKVLQSYLSSTRMRQAAGRNRRGWSKRMARKQGLNGGHSGSSSSDSDDSDDSETSAGSRPEETQTPFALLSGMAEVLGRNVDEVPEFLRRIHALAALHRETESRAHDPASTGRTKALPKDRLRLSADQAESVAAVEGRSATRLSLAAALAAPSAREAAGLAAPAGRPRDRSAAAAGRSAGDGVPGCRLGCPWCTSEEQEQAEWEHRQQQQQQQPGQQGARPVDSVFADPPVDHTSPFLWRRLLWGLLGRVAPRARAVLEDQAGMCPHSSDKQLWHWAFEMLQQNLVVLADPRVAALASIGLDAPTGHVLGRERTVYARALNRAFETVRRRPFCLCLRAEDRSPSGTLPCMLGTHVCGDCCVGCRALEYRVSHRSVQIWRCPNMLRHPATCALRSHGNLCAGLHPGPCRRRVPHNRGARNSRCRNEGGG